MAAFIRTGGSWAIESSTKTAVFSGQWGKPPDAHILRIGSDHVGVKLETAFTGQGAFTINVSILVPWRGEIREAFDAIVAEGNGGGCGEEGMLPCVESHRDITFVKSTNPGYDEIVVTLSGTKLSEKPPYKVVEVSATEHEQFSDGKYVHAAR